jgi:hypothetical protein
MRKLIASLSILSVVVSGCATLVMGTTDNMSVHTNPSGAQVTVNGEVKGLSPVSFKVPSDKELNIQITKDGYQPQDVQSVPVDRGGYELGSLALGLIPLIIDRADGAAMGHPNTNITVILEPVPVAAANSTSAAQVGTAPPAVSQVR